MENSRSGIILHDYFNILGGGERLVGVLANHTGWPVLAGFVGGPFARPAAGNARASAYADEWIDRVQTLGCRQGLAPLQVMSLARGFRDRSRPFLEGRDTVFYSGTYAPLGVLNSPAKKNIYYCHSPARFVYDQRDFYLSAVSFWQRPVLRWLIRKFQPLYEQALPMMDVIVANSQTVRKRLKDYLGLEAEVIYPPCDTGRFCWLGQSDFYLSTARLDPLKRVDLVVEAFLRMPEKRLVVVSGGSEADKIRKQAAGAVNIRVLGWVDENRLRELMGTCIATIYIPRDEDFGMSPVESMAAGKPVIGVQEGGLLETVGDENTREQAGGGEKTGGKAAASAARHAKSFLETDCGLLLRPKPQAADIVEAVYWMTPQRALELRQSCEARAEKFNVRAFLDAARVTAGVKP